MNNPSDNTPLLAGCTVLVTGGLGYIGSHTVLALKEANCKVIILDNISTGLDITTNKINNFYDEFIIGDILDKKLLERVFKDFSIQIVIHFAALSSVEESFSFPDKYQRNNVEGTKSLLEAMVEANVKFIVFASSCSTYGWPQSIPIKENHPQNAISPYGLSKFYSEQLLLQFEKEHDVKYVGFRFFNAAGADPMGRLGENHKVETHLIPLALQAAVGLKEHINIFGTDYPSIDGTCIRDYIHVTDIAKAHVLGMEYILKGGCSKFFNLGNEKGFTVKQVISTVNELTGRQIIVNECEKRKGDPPSLLADCELVKDVLGWSPKFSLSDMIEHAWKWQQKMYNSDNLQTQNSKPNIKTISLATVI